MERTGRRRLTAVRKREGLSDTGRDRRHSQTNRQAERDNTIVEEDGVNKKFARKKSKSV